jgi:NAD(P)-dependent dehydrogenase (short-subunit alcohol dehydrogenase family)
VDLKLADQTVVITGASQGIGEAIAHGFAAEGCRLRLVARSEQNLAGVAAELRSAHGCDVAYRALDLSDPGAVTRVVDFAEDADVVVNNAGSIPGGDLWDVDDAAWRRGWELKVFGYINMTRAFLSLMRGRGAGVIINNIGNGGENYDFDYIAGTTGNAALMAFTRAVGGRSIDFGVRVVGVNPGPVETARIYRVLRSRADNEEHLAELVAGYPAGRMATVAEIADVCTFLASPRSGYTSGTIVTVDGGITSRRSI